MLIPIGTEKRSGRVPWATIGLILVNVVLHVIVWPDQKRASAAVEHRAWELGLLENEIEARFLPRQGPREAGAFGFVTPSRFRQRTSLEKAFWADFEAGRVVDVDDELHVQWIERRDAFQDARKQGPFWNWATHDKSSNPLAVISAMFLHAGFWHLFFNMVFLWAVAVNVEDVWGPGLVVALYLLTGLCAEVVDWLATPGDLREDVFGMGASGAVAGLMGAFLVRHWRRKVRCFLLITFAVVSLPAWILLPYWFLSELYAALEGISSGVAHWAHVGGFASGIVLALAIHGGGSYEQVVRPELERKDREKKRRKALEDAAHHAERGDTKGMLGALEKARHLDPSDPEPVRRLVEHHLTAGDLHHGAALVPDLFRRLWQAGRHDDFLATHEWLEKVPAVEIPTNASLRAASLLADRDLHAAARLAHEAASRAADVDGRRRALELYAELLDRLGHAETAARTRQLLDRR